MQQKPLVITSLTDAIQVCDNVIASAPAIALANIPTQKVELSGGTRWHDVETTAWIAGEAIRRWLTANSKMRRDTVLLERLMQVISTRTLRRGRQSFLMCLGANARRFSEIIANYLDDDDVCGHAASALIRMREFQYAGRMDPLLIHRATHIRKIAERYIARSVHGD